MLNVVFARAIPFDLICFALLCPCPGTQIVLTFFEMIAILHETFDVKWPAAFGLIISHCRAAFANLAEFSALACATHMDQYVHLLLWTFGTIFVILAMGLRYRVRAAQLHVDGSECNVQATRNLWRKFLKV